MYIFLLVLSLVTWTEQHLSYPVNYCYLGMTCIHDNRPVCASTPDGCSRRTFLDQCDMYEFNCDYNTRYQETYSLYCMGSGLEAKIPVITVASYKPATDVTNTLELLTFVEENNIEDTPTTTSSTRCVSTSSTQPCACLCQSKIPKISPVASTITSTTTISTPYSSPITITTTTPTSSIETFTTPSTTIVTSSITTTPALRTTVASSIIATSLSAITSPSIEINHTHATNSTTTIQSTTTSPSTRTTTTQTITPRTTSVTTTEKITTKSRSSTTTYPIKSETKVNIEFISATPITTTKPILTEETTTVSSTSRTQKDIELNKITLCCDRPKTWETTTKNIKVFFFDSFETDKPLYSNTVTSSNNFTYNTTNRLSPRISSASKIESTSKMTQPISSIVSTTQTLLTTTTSTTKATSPTQLNTSSLISTTSSTTNVTLNAESTTPKKITQSKVCCERPNSWETTTKITQLFNIINNMPESTSALVSTSNNTYLTTKNDSSSTTRSTSQRPPELPPKTDSTTIQKPLTKSTIAIKTLPVYVLNSTYIKTTDSTMLQAKTTTKGTTVCTNCERPTTWDTTTKRELSHNFDISLRPVTEQKTTTPLLTPTRNLPKTTDKIETLSSNTDTSSEEKSASIIQIITEKYIPNDKDDLSSDNENFETKESEASESLELIRLHGLNHTKPQENTSPLTEYYSHLNLDMESTWYLTPCKSLDCERPATWATTRKRQRWRRNND